MSEETKSLFVKAEQEIEETNEVIQEVVEVKTTTDETEKKLREMKVIDLRKLAYTLDNVPIPKARLNMRTRINLFTH